MVDRRRPSVRARITALATLASLVVLTPLAPTAHAADNARPAPVDDTTTIYAGGTRLLKVLHNDTDPDGDRLEICRIGDVSPGLVVSAGTGTFSELRPVAVPRRKDLSVTTRRSAAGKTLTFTYYACDAERLAPATVSVAVLPSKPTRVRVLPRRAGQFQVRNVNDFWVDFEYFHGRGGLLQFDVRRLRPKQRVRITVRPDVGPLFWSSVSWRRGYGDRGVLRGL